MTRQNRIGAYHPGHQSSRFPFHLFLGIKRSTHEKGIKIYSYNIRQVYFDNLDKFNSEPQKKKSLLILAIRNYHAL